MNLAHALFLVTVMRTSILSAEGLV